MNKSVSGLWPKVLGNKKSWYYKPEMYGHRLAKDQLDKVAELHAIAKTPEQRYVVDKVVRQDADKWNSFDGVSNAEIGRVKHVLKALTKEPASDVSAWYSSRSGMWRDNVSRALGVLAMQENPKKVLAQEAATYSFYGMSKEDALKRARELYKSYVEKVGDFRRQDWQKTKRGALVRKTKSGKKVYKGKK